MRTIYDDKYFRVVAPEFPLNSREDGGHLILFKKLPVRDRSDLTYQEAIDFMRITMIVGRAMCTVGRFALNSQVLASSQVSYIPPSDPKSQCLVSSGSIHIA
jgi:diadenosine tetraphosphate (Ap4A) HIT family hydrolase